MLHHKPGNSAIALALPCAGAGGIDQAPPDTNADGPASGRPYSRPARTAGSVGFARAPEIRGRFSGDLHDLAATPFKGTKPFEAPASPAKRRIFTAEEKARIVAESFEPGESVCSVARRHHLMSSQLFSWRKHARLKGKGEELNENRTDAVVGQTGDPPKTASPIEIAIGTTIVRVPEGADAATLRAVLRALSETS
ncbi:hypothetical protein CU048_03635 [Beijerinckiaceae bacterium]|nr:hypothetical protein CU048_03635 [Beijerinckiaceae bacterium]